jgi:putative glycosyltransferase (TIGR04348 family)
MPRPVVPSLLLVTPFLAAANNGNWRTAARWARLLAPDYRVIVQGAGAPVTGGRCDAAVAMLALHAGRSAAAVAAWRNARPERALLVALTGTDLYRDLPAGNAATAASMAGADRLVVLQEDAPMHVPAPLRPTADVVFQSARSLRPWPHKAADRLHCVLVAHLRDEKDPSTAFAAWRLLPPTAPISLTVVGAALDPALGAAVNELAAVDRRVRWLGPRPHAWTRQAIRRAHLVLVPSRMEGGANVIAEAVTAATPVVASRVSGNVGMLGGGYAGYFPAGDAAALATVLQRAHGDAAFRARLAAQCARRAPLFDPATERAALLAAVANALAAAERRAGRIPA